MADYTSERRNKRKAPAAAAVLALLAGAVYGAHRNVPARSSLKPQKDSDAAATAQVTAVRFWSLGEVTRISIEVSADFKYQWDRLPNPDRLFFDIEGARPEKGERAMHTVTVGDALVKDLRVAETQPGVTRVVLDMQEHTPHATFTASQLKNPDRLMVEVTLKDKPAPPAAASVSGVERVTDAPLSELAPDLTAPHSAAKDPAPPVVTPVLSESYPLPEVPLRAQARPFRPAQEVAAPLPVLSREILTAPVFAPPPAAPPVVMARLSAPSIGKWDPRRSDPVVTPPVPPDPKPAAALTPAAPSSSPEAQKTPLPAKVRGSSVPSLTRVLGLKLGRVVIDAGHGGHDAGTRGPSGLLEKDVTLDVAMRLGKLLEERLGTDVVYTRTTDTYVGLEERTQIANDHKADLFLSIHVNSSPYKSAAGVETYYLNFTTSKTALDLAAKENAGSQSSIFDLRSVLEKIAQKDKIDESREFATKIQSAMAPLAEKDNAAAKNRGIKRAPFVVLIGATMPSVLVEIGFLTNSNDEALLRKPEHRQKIAEALYKGISAYADTLSHFQVATRQ